MPGGDLALSNLLKTLVNYFASGNGPTRIDEEFEALELGGHREESGTGFISDGI